MAIKVNIKGNSTIPVDMSTNNTNIEMTNNCEVAHKILHSEIVAETHRATAREDELDREIHTKQNLGYIKLDKYLMNPDCGVITDRDDLFQLNSYLVNKVSVNNDIYYLTVSDNIDLVYFCTSVLATKNQITVKRATGQFQVTEVEVGTTFHNLLHNLDYLSSGHTGFAGIEFGTTAQWNSRPDYRPVEGMIVVYTDYAKDSQGKDVYGIKVGDGNAYLKDKGFIAGNIADILREHINNEVIHITEAERQRWDNKINLEKPTTPGMEDLLIFNRN